MNAIASSRAGFALPELLLAATILALIAGSLFGILDDVQRSTAHQADVADALDSVRLAVDVVEQYLRTAGNDPKGTGIAAVTHVGVSEVGVRADLTGFAAPAEPDKGDPDGDTDDSEESVVLRHNPQTRSLDIIRGRGTPQSLAQNITAFSIELLDGRGNTTAQAGEARAIRVRLSGQAVRPDPRTGDTYGLTLTTTVPLSARF